MKFFVPHASDSDQAERVFRSIAQFVGAAVPSEPSARIHAIAWRHNGQQFDAQVGKSMPSYFKLGDEPVLAILDCGTLYKICTPSRGGLGGEPILASKHEAAVTVFSS